MNPTWVYIATKPQTNYTLTIINKLLVQVRALTYTQSKTGFGPILRGHGANISLTENNICDQA